MKKIIILISLITVLLFTSCISKDGDKAAGADYSSYEGLQQLMEEEPGEYYIVDVRTAGEFAEGSIPGAINIPFDLIADNPPTDDKDAIIVVYCRSGNRSGQAYRTLESLGYKNLHDFGAFGKWKG